MLVFRVLLVAVPVWGLVGALATGCGDDSSTGAMQTSSETSGVGDAGGMDAFYPEVEPSDPCDVAGYFFDGESDCNVVRCPELTCECSGLSADAGAEEAPPEEITLSACVPDSGCLDQADCNRVCDPSLDLERQACEARIAAAGSQSCRSDDDCIVGECREESVGRICVDALGCSEDGHCGAGSACLFDPSQVDAETGFVTSLGACASGREGSRCYEDDDCQFGRCEGNRCTGGADGDSCRFNDNCASGFCRILGSDRETGTCVSGERGAACADDGDCGQSLHCAGSVCASGAVGQACSEDAHCDTGLCVSGLCRAGTSGSSCEDDGDCADGYCVGFYCASGGFLAPCVDAADCDSGLDCARRVCTDGSAGSPCDTDENCSVLACVGGTCSAGANGAECDADDDCQSNRCADPAGVEPGVCTSGMPGSACVWDDNCISGDCAGTVCN